MAKECFPTLTKTALFALLVTLAGCVTTTDSRFAREADRTKAIENYVQLATAYIGQDNIERARFHVDRALELDDDNAKALAAQGLVFQAQGESRLAGESYRRALSADSSYTRGRVYYGAFLFGQGNFEGARNEFRRASEDTDYKDRAGIFFNLGMTEERLGNLSGAENAYRRAVEISRGEPRSLLSLSRVLVEQGEFSSASRYYSQLQGLIQRSPRLVHSPESLYTGIRIARHFGDRNQESSLALLLRNEYPESLEHQQYKVLIANDQ
ncbi:MAG: type IV pilus biogenesis/stability protein PilW [Pseudomonadota bacterium]|nr:type IV pilus biogenesis/stability protein PilW [Pseudomonadota bacterium]